MKLNKFIYTQHALEQMAERGIDKEIVEFVLINGQIRDDKGDGQQVYQSIVFFGLKPYLVRVFVNASVEPFKIKTVYRTSKENKIKEYYGIEI